MQLPWWEEGECWIPKCKSITVLAVTNMQKCVCKCCDISSSLSEASVRTVKTGGFRGRFVSQ